MKKRLIIFLLNIAIFFTSCASTQNSIKLLSADDLLNYFQQYNKNWQVVDETVDDKIADTVHVFTIKDQSDDSLFRVANSIDNDAYSLQIIPYVAAQKAVPELDHSTEATLINTAVDLVEFSTEVDIVQQIEAFKKNAHLSNCDSLVWHMRDQAHVLFIHYQRDTTDSGQYKLVFVKLWNNALLKIQQPQFLLPDQLEDIKVAELSEMATTGSDSKKYANYRLTGSLVYDLSSKPAALPSYICLDDFAIDTSVYEAGYIESGAHQLPVLIPNYFRNYQDIENSQSRILVTYCADENVFVVRGTDKLD